MFFERECWSPLLYLIFHNCLGKDILFLSEKSQGISRAVVCGYHVVENSYRFLYSLHFTRHIHRLPSTVRHLFMTLFLFIRERKIEINGGLYACLKPLITSSFLAKSPNIRLFLITRTLTGRME